jgi:hypothetical protein
MAASKGNRFWEIRSKHGRDVLFADSELLWEAACEYFNWCEENTIVEIEYNGKDAIKCELPKVRAFTIQGLCLYLNCNSKWFNQIKDSEKYKNDIDFSNTITRIEETIYNQKFTYAAAGFLESKIIMSDLGLAQKKEVEMQKRVVRLLDPEDTEE